VDLERLDPVTVPCLECGIELAGDSRELRLKLTCDDEPIVYCEECCSGSSATAGRERAARHRTARRWVSPLLGVGGA
jgi:hypothetical protein